MEAEKANYSISLMARVLKVSRQGYYKWRARKGKTPARKLKSQLLDAKVSRYHEASDGIYGSPRIHEDLEEEGVHVNIKTVAASMRRLGIQGRCPRKAYRKPKPQKSQIAHPDLCERKWDSGKLRERLISDITQVPTGEGWLYICQVKDAHSRRVLGQSYSARPDTELVVAAFEEAVCAIDEDKREGVVFHADRGSQFTSHHLAEVAVKYGVKLSMGRTGVCWDNAMQESHWSSLKTERTSRRVYATRAEAEEDVREWTQWFNVRRRHSAIGGVSPVVFEASIRGKAAKTKQPQAA